jgi:hypothetical protein
LADALGETEISGGIVDSIATAQEEKISIGRSANNHIETRRRNIRPTPRKKNKRLIDTEAPLSLYCINIAYFTREIS